MKDLRARTISGVGWSAVGQAGRQAAILSSNVVLARLLTPTDFGLIATAVIFSNFTFIIAEQGFGFALIQRKEVSEDHLSSTFWVNLGLGVVLAATFAACGPWVARVWGQAGLVPIMRLMALMFLVQPLGSVHKVLLTRELAFRALAIVETVAAWTGGAAAVLLAWRGFGVMSVAAQYVIEAGTGALALWTLSSWRPRARLRPRALADLAGFSTNLFLSNVAAYWVRNVDNLLVGLYLGEFALGLYSRAYAVMLFPMSRVSWMFSRVMIRSFAVIKDDPERVRRSFLRMSRAIALVTFPMMLGVAACAPSFVACLFGRQWTGMVPTLRVLALVGLVQSVTSLFYSLYLSHDRADLNFRVSLPVQALQVLGIVAGLRWGILGVATGYALASVADVVVDCRFGGGLVGLDIAAFARNFRGVFLCAAVMAAADLALEALLPPSWSPAWRLGLEAVCGGLVYVGLLHACGEPGYREARSLLAERLEAA